MLRWLLVASVLFVLCISPARAELGPKDGADIMPYDLHRVKVGDLAPDFTLENIDGKRVTLSEFRGKKNVVLVFYRGRW